MMDSEVKGFMLAKLGEEFLAFMQKMKAYPGTLPAKQNAFTRFDEAHMWMQNAVLSYPAQTQATTPAENAQDELTLYDSMIENKAEPTTDAPVEPLEDVEHA